VCELKWDVCELERTGSVGTEILPFSVRIMANYCDECNETLTVIRHTEFLEGPPGKFYSIKSVNFL
jgi:hypothetical protein